MSETIFNNPFEESGLSSRFAEPCILVIFGATGDLTARKLIPALYNLAREGGLPPQFACVGFARREKTHDQFREEMKDAIAKFSRVKPVDEALWDTFKNQLFYHTSEFHDPAGFDRLSSFLKDLDQKLGTQGNRVFYLSTQPSFFPTICEQLHKAKLISPEESTKEKWARIIIEKPFGHDLTSALALQKELTKFLNEKQIYRIDHYLGKETVQNLLVLRFANSLFESLWNSRYIDHIQITVAEDIGIGTRGAFWEEAGYLRDILQNHIMQILSLIAMEPPANLSATAIHDEKVKAIQSIRPFNEADLHESVIRGQYSSGYINGDPVIGYREEKNVNPKSFVETYVAMRLYLDNWRWAGVPFYIRGGKRLPKKGTEISVFFKEPPSVLFQHPGKKNEPNVLTIRIQPDEGTSFKINCKVPGSSNLIQPVKMNFQYGKYFGLTPPEAYERLILDCILGDNTLFARVDEVFASWQLVTPILETWNNLKGEELSSYASGSWGPAKADLLLKTDGRKWRLL
ncbi:MAG: glucose-6-phosphate dehydrogenase [Verrucomicrobia bacterium]|nr:glucose-6-phosphate dehydrogenase [Verrucomicrobiota bacterium]